MHHVLRAHPLYSERSRGVACENLDQESFPWPFHRGKGIAPGTFLDLVKQNEAVRYSARQVRHALELVGLARQHDGLYVFAQDSTRLGPGPVIVLKDETSNISSPSASLASSTVSRSVDWSRSLRQVWNRLFFWSVAKSGRLIAG